MKRAAIVAAVVLVIGVACGGGGGSGGEGTSSTATVTADFVQLRDSLSNQLDSIGVNIGSMPDDVMTQVLNKCRELKTYADESRVNDLCNAISRARDTNDFGLVDQIVQQLRQLTPK